MPTKADKINTKKKTAILDVGCGTGEILSTLASKKGLILAGIDISPEIIKIASEKANRNIDFKIGDAEELPWKENCFDLIICTYSFHHYPRPEIALREMQRVLKPKGQVMIGDSWAPAPFRQLINFFSPVSKEGKVRVYAKSEVDYLLKECGFKSFKWELLNKQTFFTTARADK